MSFAWNLFLAGREKAACFFVRVVLQFQLHDQAHGNARNNFSRDEIQFMNIYLTKNTGAAMHQEV